jgi:hypothetical protein
MMVGAIQKNLARWQLCAGVEASVLVENVTMHTTSTWTPAGTGGSSSFYGE